jgi:glyoxylase-like metal-dependent hydrolase (beta-lactamase superfamily II)
LKLKVFEEGIFESNVFLIVNDDNEAIIIDAGVETSIIKSYIKNDINIKYILLTHAHVDHIYYVNDYSKEFNCKVYLNENEKEIAFNAVNNVSYVMGEEIILNSDYEVLRDEQILDFGSSKIKVIETPGHTPGGVCFLTEDKLFTGDTLFSKSIGRTDLYRGNTEILIKSVKNKLLVLDDNVKIYPGHGMDSTIGEEKRQNMYLR